MPMSLSLNCGKIGGASSTATLTRHLTTTLFLIKICTHLGILRIELLIRGYLLEYLDPYILTAS